MEQRCTCGALLPPDARFCHKCGKPQFEEDVQRLAALEADAAPTPPSANPAPHPEPIGLGNLRAIGATMAAAALALLCMMALGSIIPATVPIILCAAGFAAARFYGSKRSLSAIGGALLGTMTGMWLFIVVSILVLTMSSALAVPEVQSMVMKTAPPGTAPEMVRIFQDPHLVFTRLLVPMFFALLLLSTFGGLLAARLRRPNR